MTAPLQLDEDRRFDEASWRLQRIGWVMLLFIEVAAVLGFFGTGPLDKAEVAGNGIRLHYSRFERMASSTDFDITLEPADRAAETVILRIERRYLKRLTIDTIVPQPRSTTASGDSIVYSFRRDNAEPLQLTVHARISEGSMGILSGEFGSETGTVRVNQFVWP